MKARIAWSSERFELAEVRLFRTADFDCSRSGSLRTVFGVRLRLLFAMASGLHSPRRKACPQSPKQQRVNQTYPTMTAPKLLLREIATSFHAAKRNRDLSGFDAINQT